MFASRLAIPSPEISAGLVLHKRRRRNQETQILGSMLDTVVIDVVMLDKSKVTYEMRAAYIAFCNSEEDTTFRERTCGNRKDVLPE